MMHFGATILPSGASPHHRRRGKSHCVGRYDRGSGHVEANPHQLDSLEELLDNAVGEADLKSLSKRLRHE